MTRSSTTTSSSHEQSDDSIRLLKPTLCNRSDNASQSCKKDNNKLTISTSKSRNSKDEDDKSKRFTRTRHKNPSQHISADDSITPLMLPNILEKL